MPKLVWEEASAATAVGTNLTEQLNRTTSGRARILTRIGVVGSAAVGDFGVLVFVGDTRYGPYYNTTAGAVKAVTEAKDWQQFNVGNYPAEAVTVQIFDASGTNVGHVEIEYYEK